MKNSSISQQCEVGFKRAVTSGSQEVPPSYNELCDVKCTVPAWSQYSTDDILPGDEIRVVVYFIQTIPEIKELKSVYSTDSKFIIKNLDTKLFLI